MNVVFNTKTPFLSRRELKSGRVYLQVSGGKVADNDGKLFMCGRGGEAIRLDTGEVFLQFSSTGVYQEVQGDFVVRS